MRTVALLGAMLIGVAACGSSSAGVQAGRADQTESSAGTGTTTASSDSTDTTETDPTDSTETDPTDSTDSTDTTDSSETTDSSDTTDSSETTDSPTTDAPSTSAAPVTTVAVTEAPTTTASAPTTTAAFPGGWKLVESFDPDLYGPEDESNWTGVPSPQLPPAGQPLADGIYPASAVGWSAANPSSLDIVVQRLDPCAALPADDCISFGDPLGPGELGINDATTTSMTIPLDGSVGVGLVGFECDSIDKTGNGADLAALFSAFDTAYNTVIAPQLAADPNADTNAIADAIKASPSNGFSDSDATCAEPNAAAVVFHSGDAPPILMQSISGYDYDQATGVSTYPPLTPITATYLNTVQVSGGKMTLFFYAGFFS